MRNYALHRAASLGEFGAISHLRRFLRNWVARRAIARLDNYDDFLLRDIGVTRDDIRWASHLPLSQNAALALEERSVRQRRADFARRPGWGRLEMRQVAIAAKTSSAAATPGYRQKYRRATGCACVSAAALSAAAGYRNSSYNCVAAGAAPAVVPHPAPRS